MFSEPHSARRPGAQSYDNIGQSAAAAAASCDRAGRPLLLSAQPVQHSRAVRRWPRTDAGRTRYLRRSAAERAFYLYEASCAAPAASVYPLHASKLRTGAPGKGLIFTQKWPYRHQPAKRQWLRGWARRRRVPIPPNAILRQHLSSDGRWRVRPVRLEEVPTVAALQAEAFYEPLPVGPLNKPLYFGFQAEVLSGIRQKLQYTAQDGFACLVAEDADAPAGIVGVVEVSLQTGKPELAALSGQGLEELVYAYVACMAVSLQKRRQGVASALLGAAEVQAGKWRQNWVLLHVYNSNSSGISLYRSNGYAVLQRDPDWRRLFGQRKRLLLAKGAALTGAAGAIQSVSGSVMRIFQQQTDQQF